MSPYFLDANVLSELWKPRPDANVILFCQTWEWFLPVPIIAEIQEALKQRRAQRGELESTAGSMLSQKLAAVGR